MLLGLRSLQQGSGWIKALWVTPASYYKLHQDPGELNRCAVFVVAQSDLRSETGLRPPPLVSDVSVLWAPPMPSIPLSALSLSLSLDLAPEKVTRAWHAMLAPGPGPRVPPPDIGSKCRNKCQPRSPSTSDGGKQPRVKWTLIGPLIDTLPRLTLIYLHWFSCLCSNQQQALCYISSCDLKQFCFHNINHVDAWKESIPY